MNQFSPLVTYQTENLYAPERLLCLFVSQVFLSVSFMYPGTPLSSVVPTNLMFDSLRFLLSRTNGAAPPMIHVISRSQPQRSPMTQQGLVETRLLGERVFSFSLENIFFFLYILLNQNVATIKVPLFPSFSSMIESPSTMSLLCC